MSQGHLLCFQRRAREQGRVGTLGVMGRSQRSLAFQFFLTAQCPLPSQPCSDCFSTLVINPVFVSPLTQAPESGGGVAAEEGTDKKSGKRRWTGAAGRQP